jgi:hypothetical protein
MLHKALSFSKVPYLIMILFFLLLSWIASGWLDIDILRSKSLDEYVFHRVILNIHEGFLNFDLRQIFSIYFYLYGFSYFFLNYLLVLPFLDLETSLTVFLPRMISTFSMFMTWLFLHKLIVLKNTDIWITYLILVLYIFMPGVWLNATWFHPDFLMTWIMMIAIYLLFISKFSFNNYFLLSIFFWSIAISIKFQAVMLAPLYVWSFLYKVSISNSKIEILRQLIITTSIVLFTYLILNPYLLHPDGISAWIDSAMFELKKNSVDIHILDKLENTFLSFFISKIIFTCICFISIYVIFRDIIAKNFTYEGGISFCYLANLSILIFFSNKLWSHYYLPLGIFALIILGIQLPRLKSLVNNKYIYISVLILLASSQIYSNGNDLLMHFEKRLQNEVVKYDDLNNTIFLSEDAELDKLLSLQKLLKKNITQDSQIISSAYINVPMKRLGLKQQNNTLIYEKLNIIHLKKLRKSKSNINFIISYIDKDIVSIQNKDDKIYASFIDREFDLNIKKYFIFKEILFQNDIVILTLEKRKIV